MPPGWCDLVVFVAVDVPGVTGEYLRYASNKKWTVRVEATNRPIVIEAWRRQDGATL